MSDPRRVFTWAGRGNPAVETDEGWYIADREWNESLPQSTDVETASDARALVIRGQRLDAIRGLEASGQTVDFAYADIPRRSSFRVATAQEGLTTWLTLVHSHIEAVARVLSDDGLLAIHIDDASAAYAREIADSLPELAGHAGTLLWQKKYAGQPDLNGKVDAAHDFIYLYSRSKRDVSALFRALQHGLVGKTEDATREYQALRDDGVVTAGDIPKTAKPRKLVEHVLHLVDLPPGGVVLEVFGETGYVSRAAVGLGHKTIFLAGPTAADARNCAEIAIPAICEAQPEPSLEEFSVEAQPPGPAVIDLAASPLASNFDLPKRSGTFDPIVFPSGVDFIDPECDRSFCVDADAIVGLEALESALAGTARLVAAVGPQGPADSVCSDVAGTRLLYRVAEAARRLCEPGGLIAVLVDDPGLSRARLLLDAALSPEQYAGTIVLLSEWEDANSAFQFLVLYRVHEFGRPRRLGPLASHEFDNPDGDPRGPWRDPGHKGARSGSESTSFAFTSPPYHWTLVSGELPPGCWRVSPHSGVIWSPKLTHAGTYNFIVRATDKTGAFVDASCTITVTSSGEPRSQSDVPWLRGAAKQGGQLLIDRTPLPQGVLGQSYSAVLTASGGSPFDKVHEVGAPTKDGGRTRYWEFSISTLTKAILADDVIFGATGQAKPKIKRRRPTEDTNLRSVDLSWWDRDRLAGKLPGHRLSVITTEEHDTIIDALSCNVASLALGTAHRTIIRVGGSPDVQRSSGTVERTVLPVTVNDPVTYDDPDFDSKLMWLEGFLPTRPVETAGPAGVTFDGRRGCVILRRDSWPNLALVGAIVDSHLSQLEVITVYYFTGSPPPAASLPSRRLEFRRVPSELRSVSIR